MVFDNYRVLGTKIGGKNFMKGSGENESQAPYSQDVSLVVWLEVKREAEIVGLGKNRPQGELISSFLDNQGETGINLYHSC